MNVLFVPQMVNNDNHEDTWVEANGIRFVSTHIPSLT